jgi:multidrug efflux pump subunit AcrA (membrane-fusion protein)
MGDYRRTTTWRMTLALAALILTVTACSGGTDLEDAQARVAELEAELEVEKELTREAREETERAVEEAERAAEEAAEAEAIAEEHQEEVERLREARREEREARDAEEEDEELIAEDSAESEAEEEEASTRSRSSCPLGDTGCYFAEAQVGAWFEGNSEEAQRDLCDQAKNNPDYMRSYFAGQGMSNPDVMVDRLNGSLC